MIAILLTAMLLVSSTIATSFEKCANEPAPVAVRVRGCEKPPCEFRHGETVYVEVDFTADHVVEHITPEAVATVLNVNVTYPLPEKEACNSLINSACPLEAGDVATYLLTLPITQAIPSIGVITVTLTLEDPDVKNDVLACFSVPLSVK